MPAPQTFKKRLHVARIVPMHLNYFNFNRGGQTDFVDLIDVDYSALYQALYPPDLSPAIAASPS